jgi:hypothetical protein
MFYPQAGEEDPTMSTRAPEAQKAPNDSQTSELNRFLRGLPAGAYDRLMEEVEAVDLPARHVLWESNARIRSVYFPRTCVISLLVPVAENGPVEAATVGNEGWVGVPLVMGSQSTTAHALAQVTGSLSRSTLTHEVAAMILCARRRPSSAAADHSSEGLP